MKNISKWQIWEFLQEDNGRFSSTRLFAFSIIATLIIDWLHTIFFLNKIYAPDYTTIGLVAAIMGAKVIQKSNEQKVELPSTFDFTEDDDNSLG